MAISSKNRLKNSRSISIVEHCVQETNQNIFTLRRSKDFFEAKFCQWIDEIHKRSRVSNN
ncbi:MAG: hypothetical protein HC786_16070 [Richelia sp. CSU_2_1]|nr:hypothetical protein [Microcoleus sp. SU_5_3]NJR23565.1 hypothetical protein [Richelia sp. CSU_2_1]